jgi:hypothetical protein
MTRRREGWHAAVGTVLPVDAASRAAVPTDPLSSFFTTRRRHANRRPAQLHVRMLVQPRLAVSYWSPWHQPQSLAFNLMVVASLDELGAGRASCEISRPC